MLHSGMAWSIVLAVLATTGHPLQPTASGMDSPPPDTLRATAEVGTPFITVLPEQVNGTNVVRYRLLRAPALGGVAGRSVTWIPRPSDADSTRTLLLRTVPPADTLAPDTLVLRIDVEP